MPTRDTRERQAADQSASASSKSNKRRERTRRCRARVLLSLFSHRIFRLVAHLNLDRPAAGCHRSHPSRPAADWRCSGQMKQQQRQWWQQQEQQVLEEEPTRGLRQRQQQAGRLQRPSREPPGQSRMSLLQSRALMSWLLQRTWLSWTVQLSQSSPLVAVGANVEQRHCLPLEAAGPKLPCLQ